MRSPSQRFPQTSAYSKPAEQRTAERMRDRIFVHLQYKITAVLLRFARQINFRSPTGMEFSKTAV